MQRLQNQHAADVILRSSDKESFYSWKIFLTISSPVFSAMFSLPQPDAQGNVDERHDELPVIDFEEDSCTLSHILSLCHPPSCSGKQFKVNSIRELQAVLEATIKYDMESVRCVALEELSNPSLLREGPVRIFALACQHECREAARLAAKYTLALPSLVRDYVPEFEKFHAGKLCRLLLYREACMTAACSLAIDHTWIVYGESGSLFGCDSDDVLGTLVKNPPSRKYPSGRIEYKSVHRWWYEYMKRSEYVLRRWPHGNAIKDEKLVDDAMTAISASTCTRCKTSQVSETFRAFVHIFAENIERRVTEVEINLGF